MKGRVQTGSKVQRGWPELGKIKFGAKAMSEKGKEYPVSLDYFVCDSNYRDAFMEVYGSKPSQLKITFASDEHEESCIEMFEARDSTGALVALGDGVDFKYRTANNPDNWIEANAEDCKMAVAGATWRHVLELRFVILDLPMMGLWRLRTMGKETSIPNIRDAFDKVQKTAGTVCGLPFYLEIKKVKSNKPGKKNIYPVVSLVPTMEQRMLEDVKSFIEQNPGGSVRNLIEGKQDVENR